MRKSLGKVRRRRPLKTRRTYWKPRALLLLVMVASGYLLYLTAFSQRVVVKRQTTSAHSVRRHLALGQEANTPEVQPHAESATPSAAPAPTGRFVSPNTPQSEIFRPISPRVIKRGNPQLKQVAITIDDGGKKDDRILDLMEQYGIRCTVFVIGAVGRRHPDWIARMDRMGFEVSNHTYSHKNIARLSDQQLTNELRRGQMVLTNVTHKVYPYMRPPGGSYNKRNLAVAAQNGYKVVLWSNTLADTVSGRTMEQQVQYVLSTLKNGDIILSHFGGYHTYEALKIIIPEIIKRGYKIVTISELLEGSEQASEHNGTDLKNLSVFPTDSEPLSEAGLPVPL